MQVTNEDTACLTPTILSGEDILDEDAASEADRRERVVDPEKAKRKMERILKVLKPYPIPAQLINDGQTGTSSCLFLS